jgi:hypothetical protein
MGLERRARHEKSDGKEGRSKDDKVNDCDQCCTKNTFDMILIFIYIYREIASEGEEANDD